MDPKKLKTVLAGYSQIGKAFLAATILVFGGGTTVLLYTANKLQLHSVSHGRMELEYVQVKCRTYNKKKVHPTMI